MSGMGLVAGWWDIIGKGITNEMEKEATEEQYQNQIGLSQVNANNAFEIWKRTNFEEQRRQMEKAGLSIGMMYGKGGGQGGVSSTPPGQIQKRNVVPLDVMSAMQMELQAKQLQAQIENVNANTAKTKVETTKIAGVDTAAAEANVQQTTAATEKLKAEVNNAQIQAGILQAQKELTEIQANVANQTQTELIKQIQIVNDKLYGEAQSAITKGNVDQNTRENAIQLIKQATVEQQVRIGAMKSNIQINNSQITKIATEINIMKQQNMREWDKMSQTDKEIAVKQMMARIAQEQTDFNTGAGASIKQWTSIVTDIIKAAQ